jgi:ubiquinone/menaquinone biosynthesis C-methylase UbiE
MIKLDLGAGALAGRLHAARQRQRLAIYPLPYGDGTVDAIRASHVLEHFPARAGRRPSLKEWVRVLKPGGELKIAVPDFGKIAEGYVAGVQQNTDGYVMGGQVDGADFHKALFDAAS